MVNISHNGANLEHPSDQDMKAQNEGASVDKINLH